MLGEPEWYVILPFRAIEVLINDGYVKTIYKDKRYGAMFAKKDDRILLAKKDAEYYVDDWDLIK